MAKRLKFEDTVPLMISWIRNGEDFEGMAAADLMDIARLADRYVKMLEDAAEAKALPYVEDLMKRLTDKKKDDPEGG